MKHTSGPWIKKGDWIHGSQESGAVTGICQVLSNCGVEETVRANANLIVSAPELLEALVALLKLHDGDDWDGDWPDEQARKAIAKATGQ